MSESSYQTYLQAINQALDTTIEEGPFCYGVDQRPIQLAQSMNYSLLAGGKRLRPAMLLGAYHLLKADWEKALPYALALEMIHTYSLVHDDLPAMDNDDYRRGRLTNHKVFGEAGAVLAGDGLLNLAFETIFSAADSFPHPYGLEAGKIIASRAGGQGMIGGQVIDIAQEGQRGDEEILLYIQRHKTAALFMAAMEAGVTLAQGSPSHQEKAAAYGYHYGMAFQMVDDLLDVQGDPKLLGKSIGKDAAQGKLTWPSLIGVKETRKRALNHVEKAVEAIGFFEKEREFFIGLAQSALKRVQ